MIGRRGFLSLLAGALAEPLIPKGTAFSFLGGIYRPTWQEVPTVWPIPELALYGKQSLKSYVGVDPSSARDLRNTFAACSANPDIPAMTFKGISVPGAPKLFRNRAGDWMILRDPTDVSVSREPYDIAISESLTIMADTTVLPGQLCFNYGTMVNRPGAPLPPIVIG